MTKLDSINKMNKDAHKPLKVRFCPECRTTNVNFVFRLQNVFGLLPRVECNDCNFSAVEFPLLVTTKAELEKRERKLKSKKKDASTRRSSEARKSSRGTSEARGKTIKKSRGGNKK